jgi:hypothetical protein
MPMSRSLEHAPVRVAVAEDSVLLREGLRRSLSEAGLEVVGEAPDAGPAPRTGRRAPTGRGPRRYPNALRARRSAGPLMTGGPVTGPLGGA